MAAAPDSNPVKLGISYLLQLAALATLYVGAARLGLRLDAVSGFATLVWAPSGISLAALLIVGSRLWPGVLIGAVVANVLTGAPLPVALGIGAGNTIEALAAAYALRSLPGFRRSLDRVPDVLALIVLAALVSTTLSATIGVTSLRLGGMVSPSRIGDTWRAWWLGDLIGDLVVAPVLLVWSQGRRPPLRPGRVGEAVALGACILAASAFVFGNAPTSTSPFGGSYMLFPLLIWAALRFGQRGAVTATFVISLVAVWGTVLGHGPFIRPVLNESLLALQVFMGVTAATFLVLGASASERQRAVGALELAIGEQKLLHDTASKANHAKSQFLAVMSHELRTPLTAIGGYTDLLTIGLDGPLTDKQRSYVSRIRRNGEHLLMLIDEVLNFAKIEAGQLALNIQGVLVEDACVGVEALIEAELSSKRVTFKRLPFDRRLQVRADPGRLRQILLNLLTNAIKFTGSGGTITLGAGADQANGSGAQGSGFMVEIWVRDTGIGIPKDQLTRVLEPFVQVESGNTRRYPGVGLGLSIARDLARAMDGDLRLESSLDEGTTATLVLPSGNPATGRPRAEPPGR